MPNTSHAVRSATVQTFTLKPQKCETSSSTCSSNEVMSGGAAACSEWGNAGKIQSIHHPSSTDVSLNREGWRTVLWKHSVPILWFDIVQISQVFLQKAVCHLLQTHSGTFSIVTPKILYEEPMDHRHLLSLGRRSRHFREAVMAVGSSMEHDGFHAVARASRSNP